MAMTYAERGWVWGVDFSDGAKRVIAVHVNGGGDGKYDFPWMGPITADDPTMELLFRWAAQRLSWDGGYVHLLPASGSALSELREWAKEWDAAEDNTGEGDNRGIDSGSSSTA